LFPPKKTVVDRLFAPRYAHLLPDPFHRQAGGELGRDGSNPEVRLTGIATTMVATFELLDRARTCGRARAAKRNLIIVHEPTFYGNLDDPHEVADDPMFRMKRDFIADNQLSVFRFHDHWHGHRGPMALSTEWPLALGWKKYQNADNPRLLRFRNAGACPRHQLAS
jgi:hypothetical protein